MGILALFRLPLFYVAVILMICAGASELSMAQWASAFTESALGLSKTAGDLAGPVLVGNISQFFGNNLQKGLLVGGIFPIILVISLIGLAALECKRGRYGDK